MHSSFFVARYKIETGMKLYIVKVRRTKLMYVCLFVCFLFVCLFVCFYELLDSATDFIFPVKKKKGSLEWQTMVNILSRI